MPLNGNDIQLSEHASLLYCEHYLTHLQADELQQFCMQHTPWVQSQIMIFGKRVPIPRLNAWYGDFPYRYSGTDFSACPMPPPLAQLQQQLMSDTALPYNSLLANLYRNGDDSMGWHSDDEKSLGTTPQIASISLGATRRFSLRRKHGKADKLTLDLSHGSLLLMLGDCQREWQHCLPKSKKVKSPRVNLTFRDSLPF